MIKICEIICRDELKSACSVSSAANPGIIYKLKSSKYVLRCTDYCDTNNGRRICCYFCEDNDCESRKLDRYKKERFIFLASWLKFVKESKGST